MYLKYIKLYKYRSYEYLDLSLKKGINVILGKNAQGKTNIIEAIYYFSSLMSHRFVMDKDLIKEGNDKGMMKIEYIRDREENMKIVLNKSSKKEIYKNNIKTQRSDFLGNFYSVLFSPEDLNLIKGEKELRRKFIDTDIFQLRPNYYNITKSYNHVLLHRNKLLKNDNTEENRMLIDIYTQKLINYGSEICLYRSLYIERLKETAKRIYKEISDDKRELIIKYKSFFDIKNSEDKKGIINDFKNEAEKIKEEEILKKTTLIGPHRDDIEFLLDGKNAKIYASQGQQRTIVLSLKLSEMIFIKELTGKSPVLLLDDILSELDKKRQEKLFKYVKEVQTLITVTDAQEIKEKNINLIKIENSQIIKD